MTMTPSQWRGSRFGFLKSRGTLTVALLSAFGVVVLRNAWVCDDAYITFRTIDNFYHGFGLTWNILERVQTYTHPLWMLVNAVVYSVTHEVFYSIIAFSVALSVAAFAVLAIKTGRSISTLLVMFVCLALSKAFVDFSTSGLENPLTHLILALFLVTYFTGERGPRSFMLLSLLASLGAVNRLDTIILFAPALLAYARGLRFRWFLCGLTVGLLPFVLWELFALVYYGLLVPNTAFAKLTTGIDRLVQWRQGAYYLIQSLRSDPITLTVIGLGFSLVIARRKWRAMPVMVGVLLYLIYVVSIGGCFMSGRYLAAPLLASAVVLTQVELPRRRFLRIGVMAVVLALGLGSERCTLYTTSQYGLSAEEQREFVTGDSPMQKEYSWHGITDEKAFYFQTSSFLKAKSWLHMPTAAWANQGRGLRGAEPQLVTKGTIGYFGYFAGPYIHVLDPHALSDPLLAHLPIADTVRWSPGHFWRDTPEGYIETIASGENHLVDTNLAAYYDKLAMLTQGPIFSWERLKVALKFNLGAFEHHIRKYAAGKSE